MTQELRLTLLGGAHMTLGGKPVTGFVSAKVQALLIYLAVTGRPHLRPALAALLWGDLPDEDAAANLRKALTNLRQLLDPYLLITRQTVAFNQAAPHWLDVADFEVAALSAPATAMGLYQGEFLAGFHVRDALSFEEWLAVQRERLRELALTAIQALAAQCAADGDYSQAARHTAHWLALDPWQEEAHRQMMLWLARTGQRAAALAQFETCRRVLADELGVTPGPETLALYEQIRAAAATPPLPLPAEATPLVGRSAELTDVTQRLRSAECRLLTLVGPGGVGKTRLALAAAEQLAASGAFLHQAIYVSLAGLSEASLLASAIAEACHFTFAGRVALPTQLLNYLRPKEMLLVLDNLDDVIGGSAWLTELLRTAPAVKLLVTARERLQLQGEWVYALSGLTQPDAMRLFAQSAARAQAGFTLSVDNRAAVARICDRVNGLPLGLELAANWVRVLTCQEIGAEIEASLDFLASSRRDIPERQRSLRAVLDQSWHMLTPAEQTAFARFSIFRAAFQREAAASVTGATLSALSGLVDKSILRRNADGRYEMHELLRRYAEEKLPPGTERQALGDRRAAYFAAYASQQGRYLQGGDQQEQALRDIATALEDIRAGWQWASQHGYLVELEQYEAALFHFFRTRSRLQEGHDLFATAVDAVAAFEPQPDAGRERLLARMLGRQAAFAILLGKLEPAQALLERALTLARAVNDQEALNFALLQAAHVAYDQARFAEGRDLIEQALIVSRAMQDNRATANNLEALAVLVLIQGDTDRAWRLHEASLSLFRDLNDRPGMLTALSNMGVVAHAQGRYGEARQLFNDSADLCRTLGDKRSLAICLHNLSDVAYRLARYEEALHLSHESLALFEEVNQPAGSAYCRLNLGDIYAALGELDTAWSYYRQSFQAALNLGARSLAPEVLLGPARLLDGQGETARALELLAWALNQDAMHPEPRSRATAQWEALAATTTPDVVTVAQSRGRAAAATDILNLINRTGSAETD